MRILIVGSEGFIGRNCVTEFLQSNEEVWGADLFEQPSQQYKYRKISRLSPELDELFSSTSFDAIINAAGSGNVPYSMLHPVIDFEANCLDTIRILEAVRRSNQNCRYLHLSSAAVYGNPISLPVKENDLGNPLSPYGFHKVIAENICREYAQLYAVKTAIARPFSVYGPGLKKQLFWDVYKKIQEAGNQKITLFGTGQESRDYIYITDLVQSIKLILTKGKMEGEVYNLAEGKETTIETAIQTFFGALKLSSGYTFNGEVRSGDPLNWQADISRLKKLGFVPAVSLQEGLGRLATWLNALDK